MQGFLARIPRGSLQHAWRLHAPLAAVRAWGGGVGVSAFVFVCLFASVGLCLCVCVFVCLVFVFVCLCMFVGLWFLGYTFSRWLRTFVGSPCLEHMSHYDRVSAKDSTKRQFAFQGDPPNQRDWTKCVFSFNKPCIRAVDFPHINLVCSFTWNFQSLCKSLTIRWMEETLHRF